MQHAVRENADLKTAKSADAPDNTKVTVLRLGAIKCDPPANVVGVEFFSGYCLGDVNKELNGSDVPIGVDNDSSRYGLKPIVPE